MNYREALEYISGVENFGSRPGLSRIGELLERMGRPQDALRYVHIAGTNGKGSCAAMLSSVLKAAGCRTGLFTSPYIFRFNERMQINGKEIEDDELAEIVAFVKPLADGMEDHPTEFELMTAVALEWYKRQHCDIVVLEVGLGGRLDATNIIEKPEVSVIMNIGLDHTAVLGDTLEKIAYEKAGIIKPGCPCVCYRLPEGSAGVIGDCCRERGCELVFADFSKIKAEFDSLEGQVFSYKSVPVALPLLGAHQRENAAVVIEAVEKLRALGWDIDDEALEHGLYSVSWPGRLELLNYEPPFIVDGGHNPQCARSVTDNLLAYFPDRRRVLLIGVLADKDVEGLTAILNEAADEYVCVAPKSQRALSAEGLAEKLRPYGKPVTVCESVKEGVAAALELAGEDGMACAAGSLYMVGEIRDYFGMY